jgi:photosystem II stability/assembly factor-like uncharacterized protein
MRPRLRGVFCLVAVLACLSLLFLGSGSEGKNVSTGGDPRKLPHDLFALSFPTEQDGWACGRMGTVLHTTDGGIRWTHQESGTDYTLTSVSFVDKSHGWAVGNGGTIVATKDGGKTWTKQKSPVSFFLLGVHFVNTQKGWAVGEKTHILHTTDGGATWGVQFKDQDYVFKSVSFCDEKNGWAAGEYGLIYRTDDGGKTWKKQAGGMGFSQDTGELLAGNILFNIIAVNPKTAWAVGIDGYVTKTTDGGANWTQVEKGVPKTHLFGIAVLGNTVVIGGKALVLSSTDGGGSFKAPAVEPPVTYGYIYGIVPRGNKGFVAVGKGGWIYLSDEKAAAWRIAGMKEGVRK